MNRRPVDDDLVEIYRRRAEAQDLLVQALIEIDSCTNRIDVLLERRRADQVDPPDRIA